MPLRRLLLHPYIRTSMTILLLPGWCVRLISRDLLIMIIRSGMVTIGITITMRITGRSLKEGMPDIFTVAGLTMPVFSVGMVDAVGRRRYMGGVVL